MKLFLPQLLARPKLNRQLDHIFFCPLTVVQAPMGFGKTTAIREYLSQRKQSPIFLSLMGAGGSLAYCWERLTSQILRRHPALGNQLVGLGFPENAPQAARIVDLLTDYGLSEPTLVIIDDYHLIDCPQAANLLALISSEQIHNLHLVLLARETPCLPVAELSQKGLCWTVTQEDLRFQPSEVDAYFRLFGNPISRKDAQRIFQWTDGWISGIYLIARGMQQGTFSGEREDSIEQLLEVHLYTTYDEKTRRFLEMLSFLDAFTPEQVAYVFDDRTAPAFLYSLVQGNAFLSYNRSAQAYRMTDLLREFLQKKAQQNGFNPTTLYRRMGEWFLQRGKRVLAYDYLYRAGAVETILESLNREDYIDVQFAQFPQIHMIFDGLEDSVRFHYPLAALQHIRVRALTCDRPEYKALDETLSRMERHFLQETLPEERRGRILGEIHNTWLLVAFNNPCSMVEHATKAVAFFHGRYSCLISNNTEFTFGAANLLYCYYTRPGTLLDTVTFISQNFHVLGQAVKDCGSGSESLILAEYALETGRFNEVSTHAYKAIYQSRLYHQLGIEICATFTLCRLAVLQGSIFEVERLLSQLSATVELESSSVFNTTVAVCSAYIDSCLGRTERVPAWLQASDSEHGSFMYQGLGFQHVVTGLCALKKKRFVQLGVFCDVFDKKWNVFHSQIGMIFNGIFRSATVSQDAATAALALSEALDIAVQDKVVLPFAEAAAEVLPLLSHPLIQQRYPADYLKTVALCCRRYLSGLSACGGEQIQLTSRESEVLHLLSSGKRHDEIAAALYISVPTVRYHIKNLYQKMGVNNKVAALTQAQKLGLL